MSARKTFQHSGQEIVPIEEIQAAVASFLGCDGTLCGIKNDGTWVAKDGSHGYWYIDGPVIDLLMED